MVSVNYAAIGKRIKEKRKEAGLNQKELAAKVGLSEASVSKYENGKVEDATHNMLTKFAEALGVSVAWLLGMEKTEVSGDPVALSAEEKRLISDFRSISRAGKDYILQTMQMAVTSYKEATKAQKREA